MITTTKGGLPTKGAKCADISNVAVIGAGILGAQIAVQTACFDYAVRVYDDLEGAFRESGALSDTGDSEALTYGQFGEKGESECLAISS